MSDTFQLEQKKKSLDEPSVSQWSQNKRIASRENAKCYLGQFWLKDDGGNRTLESKWEKFGIQPLKGNSPLPNFVVKPQHLFNPGFLLFIVVFDNELPQKRICSLVFVKSLTSHIFCLGTALCDLPANCAVNAQFFWWT